MNGLCLVTYADAGNYCCSVVIPWGAISLALGFLAAIVVAWWMNR